MTDGLDDEESFVMRLIACQQLFGGSVRKSSISLLADNGGGDCVLMSSNQ
jgi:hypothetical protein